MPSQTQQPPPNRLASQRKTCAFRECEKPARSRSLCHAHYEQWRKGKQLKPLLAYRIHPDDICSFDGCEKPVRARGLCNAHYRQQKRGNVLAPLGGPRYERDMESKPTHAHIPSRSANSPKASEYTRRNPRGGGRRMKPIKAWQPVRLREESASSQDRSTSSSKSTIRSYSYSPNAYRHRGMDWFQAEAETDAATATLD